MRSATLLSLVAGAMLVAACTDNRPAVGDLGVPDLRSSGDDLTASTGTETKCSQGGTSSVLSNLPGSHRFPRVAFVEPGFIVGWNTEVVVNAELKHRVVVTLTDNNGSQQGPNVPMSADPVADVWGPSIARLTNGTVVAWARLQKVGGQPTTDIVIDSLDANAQRLDQNGTPCDPSIVDCGIFPVTSSGTASYPSLARPETDPRSGSPTDNQVALAWVDSRNHPCTPPGCVQLNDVFWKKITANGQVLVQDKQITVTATNGRYTFPRLAFDGAHTGMVWRDDASGNGVFDFSAVDANGQISSPVQKVGMVSGALVSSGAPDLVWTGQDYALVAANGSATLASVTFQRFQSNGVSSLAPIGVTNSGVACTPAIAWDGSYFAIVWQTDCGNPGSNLAFALLDPQGFRVRSDGTTCTNVGDPTCGVVLLTQNTTAVAAFPDIAWAGGGSFGVTWMDTARSADGGAGASQVRFTRVQCTSP